MTSRWPRRLGGFSVVISLVSLVALPVLAGPRVPLYLTGGGVPESPMSLSAPPEGALPNFDPERDSEPGLVLKKSDEGASEADPKRYQQWSYDISDLMISVNGFEIWVTPKDFNPDKTVAFTAYLMDCDSSCTVLDSKTRAITGASTWRRVNLPLQIVDYTFGPNRTLVAKIVVDDSSEDDVWFAYATGQYDSALSLTASGPATTTTSTTSTTSTPSTTSTTLPTTTTTVGPTTTTTAAKETTTTAAALLTTPSSPPGESPTSPQDAPPATDPPPSLAAPSLIRSGDGAMSDPSAMFTSTRELEPAQRLTVAFETVAENINLYWQAAVALGGFASVLLWIGLTKRDRLHEPEGSG